MRFAKGNNINYHKFQNHNRLIINKALNLTCHNYKNCKKCTIFTTISIKLYVRYKKNSHHFLLDIVFHYLHLLNIKE